MRIDRRGFESGKRRRRVPQVALVLLGVVLVAVLAFGGALLWQRAEYALSSPGRAAPEPPPQPVPPEAVQPPPPPAPPPTPPRAPPEPPLTTDPEPPPDYYPSPFAVTWQVAPSQPVDISYFQRAVFFGDCVTTGLIAHRVVPGAANFAAIGQTPQMALETALETAAGHGQPDAIYIMFGSGSAHLELEEFIEQYAQFIAGVREEFPYATLYIQSMMPVGAHVGQRHPALSLELVLERNAAIAELARTSGAAFLNVFEAFAGPDGYLPPSASSDGLFLTAEYNFAWLDYLKAHTVVG